MKRSEVKNTILKRLLSSNLIPSTLIAMPGKPLLNPPEPDQQNPQLWARASFSGGDASQLSLGGDDVLVRFDRAGILTVQVFYPAGIGEGALTDKAEDIADLFEKQNSDRPIRYGQPLPVRVTETPIESGAWMMQNVVVPYEFDVVK